MTGKQLEEAKSKTPYGTKEYTELTCISMMHSILVYNYSPKQENFTFPINNQYLQKYIKTLGIEQVSQLWAEQVADFRKAKVSRDVYTDNEGCSYNSCRWADE